MGSTYAYLDVLLYNIIGSTYAYLDVLLYNI